MSTNGCCSGRLGSSHDDGLGKGQWEVERATLEGRPKGHDDESEVKEEERQRNSARKGVVMWSQYVGWPVQGVKI